MSKNLTFKHDFEYFRPGEETVTARIDYNYTLDDYKHFTIVERGEVPAGSVFTPLTITPTCTYLVGPIVDRLHAFEEIGLEPDELKILVDFMGPQVYDIIDNLKYGCVDRPEFLDKKFNV